MSNRRELKKYVRTVCGDLAGITLDTAYAYDSVKPAQVREIVNDIAALQVETLAKVGVAFDKTPRSMEPGQYRKARREYFRKAIRALLDEFNTKVEEIVRKINAALPADVRESLKESAK